MRSQTSTVHSSPYAKCRTELAGFEQFGTVQKFEFVFSPVQQRHTTAAEMQWKVSVEKNFRMFMHKHVCHDLLVARRSFHSKVFALAFSLEVWATQISLNFWSEVLNQNYWSTLNFWVWNSKYSDLDSDNSVPGCSGLKFKICFLQFHQLVLPQFVCTYFGRRFAWKCEKVYNSKFLVRTGPRRSKAIPDNSRWLHTILEIFRPY